MITSRSVFGGWEIFKTSIQHPHFESVMLEGFFPAEETITSNPVYRYIPGIYFFRGDPFAKSLGVGMGGHSLLLRVRCDLSMPSEVGGPPNQKAKYYGFGEADRAD